MAKLPEGMPQVEAAYSNFSHEWDPGAKEAVDSGEFSVHHAAWNHSGNIWKSLDGLYHEDVWVYRVYRETATARDLDELIRMVNDRYGWD